MLLFALPCFSSRPGSAWSFLILHWHHSLYIKGVTSNVTSGNKYRQLGGQAWPWAQHYTRLICLQYALLPPNATKSYTLRPLRLQAGWPHLRGKPRPQKWLPEMTIRPVINVVIFQNNVNRCFCSVYRPYECALWQPASISRPYLIYISSKISVLSWIDLIQT